MNSTRRGGSLKCRGLPSLVRQDRWLLSMAAALSSILLSISSLSVRIGRLIAIEALISRWAIRLRQVQSLLRPSKRHRLPMSDLAQLPGVTKSNTRIRADSRTGTGMINYPRVLPSPSGRPSIRAPTPCLPHPNSTTVCPS